MAEELGKQVSAEQLASLRQFYAICRDKQQQLFSFKTIVATETESSKQTKHIINQSIADYCTSREQVERDINQRLENRLGIVNTCENSLAAFR